MTGAIWPHVIALLVGGLGTSLGLTLWGRSARGRSRLERTSVAASVSAAVAVSALLGVGAFWLVRRFLEDPTAALDGVHPAGWLLVGAAVGVPIGIPGLVAAHVEALRSAKKRRKLRDHVPTKDERRAYAIDLVKQIREVSPTPRELAARIDGDGGTVLLLEGEIDAKEGEALTAALRADLAAVGFKRVEGKHGSKSWWARV